MAKKYESPITSKLTPDNWQELLNPSQVSVDDLAIVFWDMRQMQKLAKKVEGYLKEVITARMPDDEFVVGNFRLVSTERTRAGGLDVDRIAEDMGDNWMTKYRKENTEYTVLEMKRTE